MIIVTYVLFFLLLRGKLLFTPDFDRSDSFHLNISLKYYLAQILRQNQLPFWTNLLQGGFPLFAEGQIGALFLPNILFLRFLDFVSAYNALFIFALFSLTLGMYVLLRSLSISKFLALLYGFIFTFCGAISFRWVHLNVLQTLSFAPLLFWSVLMWHRVRQDRYAFLSVLFSSQILYAGHMQIAFIVYLALSLWYFFILVIEHTDFKKVISPYFRFLFLLIAAVIIALPQIIPTLQLTRYSTRGVMGGYQYATQYSMPGNHLASFISPYLYGNPKFGTYPEFPSSSGVFWENTPYTGELLFILLCTIYLYLIVRKKTTIQINLYFLLSILFILLSLGKNSPLYFIYDIFPFNVFRTPAKYLLMSVFFLIIGASLITQRLFETIQKPIIKIFVCLLLFSNVLILIYTSTTYHIFIDSKKVLNPPIISQRLNSHDTYLTFGFDRLWHDYFAKNGWKASKDIDKYLSMNNFLIPNSNLLYGRRSFDINTGGLRLRRVDYFIDHIGEALFATDSALLSSPQAKNLLEIANINSIISSKPFTSIIFSNVEKISENNTSVFLGKNTVDSLPYYIPHIGRPIQYLDDFIGLNKGGLVSTGEVVLEGYKKFTQDSQDHIDTFTETGNQLKLNTSFPQDTYVVLRRNWYPEWRLEIDGKPATIFQTNLIHIGVLIPKGNHKVTLSYVPLFFYQGIIIAIGFISLMILLKFLKRSF
ncbi:YfhO family protein [Candidatus Roizmanbacteria bacterium]|nr:YfhO family protein [Candidatus Roizmanbacteria bacterium]